jgi:N-acetylmuramoyl-L-alanine amidase
METGTFMKSTGYFNFRLAAVWAVALGCVGIGGAASAQMTLAQKRSAPIAEDTAVPPDKAAVTGVRFLSWMSYTRVMLELSQEAKYEVRRLKEDSARGLPARVYIDITGARMGAASRDPIRVDDGLLRQVRIGQYSPDVVRVVLDMNNLASHNAFVLADPYRLVIDIYGRKGMSNGASRAEPAPSNAPPRQAALRGSKPAPVPAVNGIRKIVLDPGHGGKDPGAIGPGGLAEKDIVLSIAKKLARKLTAEMGVQVVLTRNDDRYVALEDRTATANAEDADLFISLHLNASPNTEARGLETYYLDNTTDEAAIRLAARENGTSRRNISDLQFILSDMTQNMKLEDSISLAHRLQSSMVGGMTKVMSDVKDLGVKKALFYVLVGARMPSVLVEMFFITNRSEGRAMSRDNYQDAMVKALFEGIEKFGQSNLMVKTL